MRAGDYRTIYLRVIVAVEEGDFETLGDLLADDLIDHNPIPGQLPGRDGFKQWIASAQQTFLDLSATVEDTVVENDRLAGRVTFRAIQLRVVGRRPGNQPSCRVHGLSHRPLLPRKDRRMVGDGRSPRCPLTGRSTGHRTFLTAAWIAHDAPIGRSFHVCSLRLQIGVICALTCVAQTGPSRSHRLPEMSTNTANRP